MKHIQKMKRYGRVITMSAAGAVLSVTSAHAALPAAIATELTAIQTDGLALADLVWPVVIALFGALVLFKLFKRFGSKI